jgi:D-inositol-3-phosphate glycosyltransferase
VEPLDFAVQLRRSALYVSVTDPAIAMHIYGTGDEDQKLRDLATGDTRVVFKGFTASPVAAYLRVDCVLMPSRWEAYGLFGIEALFAGRSLICANKDSLRDHSPGGAHMQKTGGVSGWYNAINSAALACPSANDPSPCRHIDVLERDFLTAWRGLIADLAKKKPPRAKLQKLVSAA